MEICKFNQKGICKFGGKCFKLHENEICNSRKECIDPECCKRHPRKCRYFLQFEYCKFGDNCAYSHIVEKNNKVEQLEKEIEDLKHEKNKFVDKVEHLEKEACEVKQEVNTVKLLMKKEELEMKDELKTMKEMFAKLYRLFKANNEVPDVEKNENENVKSKAKDNDSKKKGVESKKMVAECKVSDSDSKNDETESRVKEHKKEDQKFKCEMCNYESKKENTLKKHINTKHGKVEDDKIEL